MMVIYNKQHLEAFEAKFMKKLRNTEAELKKVAHKKKSVISLKNIFIFTQSPKLRFWTILRFFYILK